MCSRGNEDSVCARLRAEIERLRKESGEKSDGEMDDTKVDFSLYFLIFMTNSIVILSLTLILNLYFNKYMSVFHLS